MAEKAKSQKTETKAKKTKAQSTSAAAPKRSQKTISKTKTQTKAKTDKLAKKTTGKRKGAKDKGKGKLKVTKEKTAPVKPKKADIFIPGTKEVKVYQLSGKSTRNVKLPIAFDESYRLDLIRRAVKAARANRRQPYSPSPNSGMSHSTSTWGKGRGVARVQRLIDGRRAVESPNNVGGRRAHPPTVEKVWAEKINKKERKKARRAALAALTDHELVANRGHMFDKKYTLPLVVEDKFEDVKKTKEALEIFQKLGVYDDIVRAKNGKHIRAGKGKGRGRKYRVPKSLLIITSKNEGINQSTENLVGVDIVTPETLSIEHLAPGGDPGRLTIITESALKMMGGW